MKRITFLILLIFGVLQTAKAQKNFTEGYIINNNDDILKCLIHSASTADLQEKIIVVTDSFGVDKTEYRPFDIKEMHMYRWGSFMSKAFKYRLAKDVMMSKDYNADTEEKFYEDSAFLKVLVSGRANLYLYKDKNFKEHYFIEKDTLLYELYEKKVFKYRSNPAGSRDKDRVLMIQKKYQGILSFIFSDNSKIKQQELIKLKLSKSALMEITHKYNLYFDKKSKVNTDELIKSKFGF